MAIFRAWDGDDDDVAEPQSGIDPVKTGARFDSCLGFGGRGGSRSETGCMDVPTYILNHEVAVQFFGHWPSFHDAKVVAYRLEADSIAFTLHTWRMTNEVDAKGYFVERDHALVSFRFHGLHELKMDAFRSGNSLFGLEITRPQESSLIHVQLESVMDLSGSFSARSGEVDSVLPCSSDGSATLQT